MGYRPKIGITMRIELESGRFYLGRHYSEALEHFGASPVHIPLIPKRDYLVDIINGLDGVLLPGADCDPDPMLYDEEPHPKIKKIVDEKDRTDLMILDLAEELALPVFGICYGMQILNVHRGGSLYQDIGTQVEASLKHDQGMPLERNSHSVTVIGSGVLSEISKGQTEFRVNSHHHQSIKKVGKGLRVTSEAKDGVIECIEDDSSGRYIIGVQWHPELSYREDEVSAGLFEKFVSAAKLKADTQG